MGRVRAGTVRAIGLATVLIVVSSTYASVVKQHPETSRVDVAISNFGLRQPYFRFSAPLEALVLVTSPTLLLGVPSDIFRPGKVGLGSLVASCADMVVIHSH